MLTITLAAALLLATAQPGRSASTVSLDTPLRLVEIDTGKLKGEPWRMAWSPDGTQLYVEAADRDARGTVKSSKGVVVTLADRSMKHVDQPPAWVANYWLWKSGQASPAAPAFKITVDQRQEIVRAIAAPTGGALAKGGTADPGAGSSLGDAASAANTAQLQTIVTLKLKSDPHAANHTDPHLRLEEVPSLWPAHEYKGYRWGMAIDLNTCTGCSACMIACQAENNVPVVGRQQVRNSRNSTNPCRQCKRTKQSNCSAASWVRRKRSGVIVSIRQGNKQPRINPS